MANIIKIKRSAATAAPTTLNEGELAFSYLSGKLFIGNSSAVIPIGGTHNPGVLTANQALVANASSAIDKIIVANLQPTYIYANGASGTAGQVLLSNSTGGVYWGTAASDLDSLTDVTLSSVANNQLLVYDNTAGQWENHSISGNANQTNVAFNSQNITISLTPSVNVDTSIAVGGNVIINASALFIGNSTVNSVVNATHVTTNTFNIAGGIAVGSNVSINTSTIFIGNSTVNTTIQAGNIALRGTQLTIGNTLFDGTLISVGNSTVNTVVNSTSVTTNILYATNAEISSSANVGGNITARANVTVNGALTVANTASLGNTTVSQTLTVGNSTVNVSINATSIAVGPNVAVTQSTITVGNSTVNAVVNSTSINVGTTGTIVGHRVLSSNITLQAPNNGNYDGERFRLYDFGDSRVHYSMGVEGGHIWTAVDNSSNSIGFKWYGNTVLAARLGGTGTLELKGDLYTDAVAHVNSALYVGSTSTNVTINSTSLAVGSNVTLDTGVLVIGNSTVNTTINSSSISTGALNIGNTTINGWANVIGDFTAHSNVQLGNSFGVDVVSFKATVNTEITPSANNTQKLGRADLRWGEVNANNVLATNVAIDSVLTVNGNTKLGDASSDVVSFIGKVNTHIIPSANLTYSLGNNTLYWAEVHTGNVHADYGYFNQDVAIYGDLTVSGNLVTTNVQSVVISDPLIYLAGNNYAADLVDIGFVGNYHVGGANLHTGLFRDASVDQYYLFKGLTQELDGVLTVNTADPTFAIADLNAYLLSGALVSNALAVTITANSTVNVNITANSLSLSTALAVGSGGTGLSTVTSKGVLYGNTTGPLGVTSAGTDGQVLQANASGYPVFADLDGGTF
jgi:hypothetical protein